MGGLFPLGVCREFSAVISTERREPLALSSGQAVRMAGPLVSLESLSACSGLQLRTSLQTRRG